jgi:hypothetical protein
MQQYEVITHHLFSMISTESGKCYVSVPYEDLVVITGI